MVFYNSVLQIETYVLILLFFSDKIFANKCNFNVKLTQTLHNEGFHRNITYGIVFDSDDEGQRWLYTDCILGLDQILPAGVFANPDELGELRRLFKTHAIPKNKVNVELPTEQSEASSVYIINKVDENKVQMWLPVHARYHRAVSGGSTKRNEIGPPRMYLRCPDQRLDVCEKTISPGATFLCNGSSKERCSWKEIQYTMLTDTLTWDVPVGNTDHYYVVAIGTALVVATGSLYLLKSIHEYKVAARRKRL